MERVAQAEKAYTASLPSEQEQDEAAEREYQLRNTLLALCLVQLIADAEATKDWLGSTIRTPEQDDLLALSERLLDVLGSVEGVYAIRQVLEG